MRRPIPDDVRRFVLASVASVPFLEAMLLMRAHPEVSWSGAELARRLYVPAALADDLLGQLCESGLASPGDSDNTFCWNAATATVATIDDLAAIYSENVVGIAGLIHSRPARRAVQFADAFRLRKKED